MRSLSNDRGVNPSEDITFVNIYVSNREAPKYIKKILKDLKRKTVQIITEVQHSTFNNIHSNRKSIRKL